MFYTRVLKLLIFLYGLLLASLSNAVEFPATKRWTTLQRCVNNFNHTFYNRGGNTWVCGNFGCYATINGVYQPRVINCNGAGSCTQTELKAKCDDCKCNKSNSSASATYICPVNSVNLNNSFCQPNIGFVASQDANGAWSAQTLQNAEDSCKLRGRFYNQENGLCETRLPKNLGDDNACGSSPHIRNPINVATGNKFQSEIDYSPNLPLLDFQRAYNSISYAENFNNQLSPIGSHWRHRLYSLIVKKVSAHETIYEMHHRNGKVDYFKSTQTQNFLSDTDITNSLDEIRDNSGSFSGWIFKNSKSGETEIYNTAGQPTSISNLSGLETFITYSDENTPPSIASNEGLLIRIADTLGRELKLVYDSVGRVTKVINVEGGVYSYTYSADELSNLVAVTYPDGKTKTYHYENMTFKKALTGISDENGTRYSTYSYDSLGRANSTEHAVAANKSTLVFNLDSSNNPTSTIVTDIGTGSSRTYNFTTVLGVVKATSQSQPAGSGCAASSAAMTYDANGNVASRTDFKGNKTTYSYDMTRNLETRRTEGLTTAGAATAASRTITTTWHATWRLPLVVSEYSGATATGTPIKTTTTTYDSKGNITSVTEADPVRSLSRTTTTTYTYSTAVPGLVLTKEVDGPRTDVNDITTYNYYPHDATCTASTAAPLTDPITNTSPANLGCRGQLMSVTNALNQTTTYDRYNHHGQVEQMTDANGLVTTSTYDLRQRLLTRTVGTETTALTYDNAGQVTQLTMPDNSTLNYTYDAAHRLTQVQDTLGNKVIYTLDAEGNRTQENTEDPSGNLTKTIARSYDALNRLQQLTGIEQ